MTELNPLEYGASVALMVPLLGMLAAWKSDDNFGATMKRQLQILAWIPAMVALWLVGRMLGIGIWMARGPVALLFMLASLWWPNLATDVLMGWRDRLVVYCRSEFHQPAHAA